MSSEDDSFHSATNPLSDTSTFSDCYSDNDTNLVTKISQLLKNKKKFFNLCHINAQSLPRHYSELHDIFSSSQFHAIFISESWLKPSYSSLLCSLQGYTLIRNDRIGKQGGGVAIYLRCDLVYKILATSPSQYSESMEYILLEVVICQVKVMIGVFYCPPNINFIDDLESLLSSFCSEYAHHISMVDFNVDLLKSTGRSREF